MEVLIAELLTSYLTFCGAEVISADWKEKLSTPHQQRPSGTYPITEDNRAIRWIEPGA